GFSQHVSLVILPLAPTETDLDLGSVAREVEAERDQRVAALLDLSDEARDLFGVKKELARAQRLVVHVSALGVAADVGVLGPFFVALKAHVPIPKVDLAGSQRLHLGPGQHQPRLVPLVDEVVVEGSPVDGDVTAALFRHGQSPAPVAPLAVCPAAAPPAEDRS